MRYVKLLDGGLVDNYGLSGFSIGLLAAERPFEPMTEQQAVKVRRMMFLVVDAGRGISGDFVQRIEGPSGVELVAAAADTAIDASVRASYAAFSLGRLVRKTEAGDAAFRRRIVPALARRTGIVRYQFLLERLSSISWAGARGHPERRSHRFALPAEQVDGDRGRRDASAKTYQAFRRGL
jgi:NTE family protein